MSTYILLASVDQAKHWKQWQIRPQGEVSLTALALMCKWCRNMNHLLTALSQICSFFSPLSVLKTLDTISMAIPLAFEKLCSLSWRIGWPSLVHAAVQLVPKLRLGGGGPHVTVTGSPKNTSSGLNVKTSVPLNNKHKGQSDNYYTIIYSQWFFQTW